MDLSKSQLTMFVCLVYAEPFEFVAVSVFLILNWNMDLTNLPMSGELLVITACN